MELSKSSSPGKRKEKNNRVKHNLESNIHGRYLQCITGTSGCLMESDKRQVSARSMPEAMALLAADCQLDQFRGETARRVGDLRPLWQGQLLGDARTGDS